MNEIDQRKAQQLERQAARVKSRCARAAKPSVAEAYSPPRLTKVGHEHGLTSLWALDLTEHDPEDDLPWDFRVAAKMERAVQKVRSDKRGCSLWGHLALALVPRSGSGTTTTAACTMQDARSPKAWSIWCLPCSSA